MWWCADARTTIKLYEKREPRQLKSGHNHSDSAWKFYCFVVFVKHFSPQLSICTNRSLDYAYVCNRACLYKGACFPVPKIFANIPTIQLPMRLMVPCCNRLKSNIGQTSYKSRTVKGLTNSWSWILRCTICGRRKLGQSFITIDGNIYLKKFCDDEPRTRLKMESQETIYSGRRIQPLTTLWKIISV